MYRALCYYTRDGATKCKLHKRRMDLIVPLANALNPTLSATKMKQRAKNPY